MSQPGIINVQPVSNQKQMGRKIAYPQLKVIPIRTLSSFCIGFGVASIFIQIAALVIYAEELYNVVIFVEGDVTGHGIWAGSFYVTAGSLGLAACQKTTTSLLVATIVFSSLSALSAIASATLSGISAGEGIYSNCYYSSSFNYNPDLCDAWWALEWTLMSIAIVSFMCAVPLLVLASVGLCGRPKKRNVMNAPVFQQQPFMYTGYSGQQMYYQPQQVLMTQQQPLNQVAYVGQQQPAVPYPVQPSTPANQPETVKVDLELRKDEKS